MLNFFKKWLRGEFGLGKTYWLFGVIAPVILLGIQRVLNFYIYQKLLVKSTEFATFLTFAIAWLLMGYILLACIAIINSSTFNRKRGVWGWIATILSVIGIFNVGYYSLQMSGAIPVSFEKFAENIQIENSSLPLRIDNVTVLQSMSTRSSDNSLIYHFKLEQNIVNEDLFKTSMEQNIISAENCNTLNEYFDGPIEVIFYEYEDPSSKITNIVVEKSDCK